MLSFCIFKQSCVKTVMHVDWVVIYFVIFLYIQRLKLNRVVFSNLYFCLHILSARLTKKCVQILMKFLEWWGVVQGTVRF